MNYHDQKTCVEACLSCASVCYHCASSCLKEEDPAKMARCIQLDMECAALCEVSARLMSLGSEQAAAVCRICAALCRECAEECEKHRNEHCAECARLCRKCAEECEYMAA
ncbi:MAG TPA: four-helix bundle copper-binding protein [Fluviicola sp.]|nr:four-helix bundle copper-binding protein [Fluviicola sp.]